MKKLLSICFLSMLLVLAGFTAKAQTTNCCFWLENLQPDTVQDISNLGITPGSAALLPGHGNALVLNNTLSRVDNIPMRMAVNGQGLLTPVFERTDWYQLHITGNCGAPDTKVSLEWKLYRDGVLLTDANIRDYADIYIYTKFDQFANTNNVNATCGHEGWLGGLVYGPGVCRNVHNDCQGGYPGSMEVDPTDFPYSINGYRSAGYVRLANGYNLDYFYLGFLQSTETRIAINWKQVGEYALVVSLRERTNGTPFAIWQNDNQDSYIGGHQSCCGMILASDSIHYLVNTNTQYAVCDGETYNYGQPEAIYSEEGNYNVLFGTYTCDHWIVDHIDALSFYTRINPNIVASNLTVCKNEIVSDADFAALAPAVNTDAPGYLGHKIYWRKGTTGTWSETVPAHPTNVPGVYTYQVYQSNHYDAVTEQDFWCDGNVAEITFTVLDVLPPVLDNTNTTYELCYSDAHDLTLKAKLNNVAGNNCADQIHWFNGTTATGTPVCTTPAFQVTIPQSQNVDGQVKFTAFSYDESTNTYSTTGVTVTINLWKNPVLAANNQTDSIVICPHASVQLKSNFKSTNFTGTHASELTWDYVWTKNGVNMNTNTADVNVTAPGCGGQDVYVVTATATSTHGCSATITRRMTVNGVDTEPLTIKWRNNSTATKTLYGCDTTNLFSGTWAAPYTMSDVSASTSSSSAIQVTNDYCSNVQRIVYSVSVNATAAPCTTIVTRTYKVIDECNNESNPISQVVTIINNKTPEIVGRPVEMLPVRPLHNNCKCNLPDRDALLAAFHADFTVTTGCQANVVDDNIKFFMGNTTTVANGNQDIFANTDQVTVYAQVTDECGNISAKTPVFILNKPAAIDIAHGAISSPVYELCNTETAHVVFDSVMIHNGLSPYVFTWSQTPVPEECGMTVAENKVEVDVWALNGGAYNTSAQFIMTVEDAYGCVTTDTSNAIRWFGMPDVTIIEDHNNDDYAHTAPVVVCPTFGHYLLTTVDHCNLPISEIQTLTYVWSGEAIDYTSTTQNSFIAVNENICDRVYTATVEVTNAKGCKATASYSIQALDTQAPVITLDMPTDTITNMENCKIIVPDYTTFFNATTVFDDCWNMDSIQVSQNIPAGTKLAENTDVVITVAPKCGPTATYTIKACFPEPRISTEILASVDSSCYPYTTIFTANTANFVAPIATYWDGATTSAASKEFTTSAETGNTLTHTVRVVDANGCEATDSYTLVVYHTPVAADVNVTSTPNHYCDAAHTDGTFTVTSNNPEVVGVRVHGTTEWFAFPYTATVNDGTYYFDLRTIHDCVAENIKNVTVAHDTVDANLVPALIIITDNANCSAPWSGTIEVTNPVVGYQYHVSAGLENSGDETITYNPAMLGAVRFNFLYQDMYTVDVLSTFNCHASASIEVEDHRHIPEIPTSDVTANTNCINPNGVITLNNTNSDYWYTIGSSEIRGNGGIITFGSLSSDYYLLTVANKYTRCFDTVTIYVPDRSNAPKLPTVTVNDNTFCVGSNGSIVLSDLNTAYQYTLKDASDNVVSLNGLAAGNYTLYVYDPVTGCESNHTYTINDALVMPTFGATEIIVTDRTACDPTLANGKIQINQVSGFSYSVLDELTNVIFDLTTLDSGNYVIVKTNIETQCLSTKHVHVGFEKPDLKLNLTAAPDIDCSDEVGTGAITAALVPATTASYTVVNATTNEPAALTGLNPGDYIVTAFVPATGCSYVGNVTVGSNYTYPTLNVVTTANYMCNSVKNGTLTISDLQTVKNYTSLTYYIDGVATVNPRTDLNGGTYEVYAITNNHCQSTSVNAVVVDSAFVVRAFDVVANSVCNPTASKPGNGQIRVLYPQSDSCDYIFTDLTPTHHYDVDHFEPIDYTKYTLEDGWYLVTITDNRTGCQSSDSVYVPYQPIEVTIDVLTSTPDHICTVGDGDGTIHVEAHSASLASILAYSIDGGLHYNLTGDFINVDASNYHIVVMDTTTHCIYDALKVSDVTVDLLPYELTFTYNNAPNTACDPNLYNGEVNVTVAYADASLGTGDFTVTIEGGSFTGLNEGKYHIYVTDNNTGCTYVDSTNILNDAIYTPQVTITAFNFNENPEEYHYCFGQTDGYMVATATTTLDGDTNFTFAWSSDCNHITPSGAWTNIYTEQAYCCTYTVVVTSQLTGCVKTVDQKVCIDTLPIINFYATGESIHQTATTPNVRFENCENKAFTLCIEDPGFKSINWTNGYTGTDACFTIAAGALTPGETSYCVKVVDYNGCSAGPTAVNVKTLPIFFAADTITACNSYTFNGVKVGPSTFTYVPGGTNIHTVVDTLPAVNSCDSIVTYTIVVNTDPTLTVTADFTAKYCAGTTIVTPGESGFIATDAFESGWRRISSGTPRKATYKTAGVAFNPGNPLTFDMGGDLVYAYAANGCDTILAGPFTLNVIDKPSIADADKTLDNDTICLGSAAIYDATSLASIDWHGSVGTAKVQYTVDGGTTWSTITGAVYPALTDIFMIRIVATNDCGTDVVVDGPVSILVNDTVKVSTTKNLIQTICLGESISDIVITTENGELLASNVSSIPTGITYNQASQKLSGAPTTPGIYTISMDVTSTAVPACDTKTIEANIIVKDTVKLTVTNDNQTICLGEDIADINITSANANVSFVPSTVPGLTITSTKISGAPTAAGTFKIAVLAASTEGCTDKIDTITIVVNDSVKLTVSNNPQTICLGENILPVKVDYANAILNTGSTNGGVTFNTTDSTFVGAPNTAGLTTLTATATSIYGCTPKTVTISITVNDTVKLSATNVNQTLCLGTTINPVEISVENATASVTGIPSSLTFASGTITGTPVAADTIKYTITATSTMTPACPAKNIEGIIIVNDTVQLAATNLTQVLCLGNTILDVVIDSANATLSVTGIPTTLSLAAGKISGTPAAADTINYVITATSTMSPACPAKNLNGTIIVNDTVKLTVASGALTQTVCKGDSIDVIDFDYANASLSIVGTLPDGLAFDATTGILSGAPTVKNTLGYVFNVKATSTADPSCGNKTMEVKIVVNDVPEITGTIIDGDLEVCLGDVFSKPTDPSVEDNGYTAVTTWQVDGSEFDWLVPSTSDMNNKVLKFVATNVCGTVSLDTILIVDTLPVPQILSDTTVCESGTAVLTATAGYASYQWYDENGAIASATTDTYNFSTPVAGTYKFTVVVTDGNGCVSNTSINATADTKYYSLEDSVTVIVNSNPGFIFKQNGVETHTINANTADASTVYTWMVANPCAYPDSLVFVNFDIYYEGNLIPNDSIGKYIQSQYRGDGYYVTSDKIQWNTVTHVAQQYTCYYNYAQSNNNFTDPDHNYLYSNHYPVGSYGYGATTFDDLYIHFLENRPVTKTINRFRRPGKYTIEYRLLSTSSVDDYMHQYEGGQLIGGHNSIVSTAILDTLAFDVITINVEGEAWSPASAPSVTPTPEALATTDAPSMQVYPNPAHASDQVKARIQGINGNTTVRIVNLAGKVISQESININTVDYLYTCQISNLTPGVYFIYVQGENATISRKLVVTK